MIWNTYPDRDALFLTLAKTLAAALIDTLNHKDRGTLAVPGGTSPGPVFKALSQVDLPWDRVDIMLTDERWVPESSDRSNTALLRQTLLIGPAAAATLIPLVSDAPTPEDTLTTLSKGIEPHLPIDVLLLGMGPDMHTASLFPGADRLNEGLSPNAPTLLPMRAPGAPEPRVTLTAPVLKAAARTHILIMGQEKKAAMEAASTLSPKDAPVAIV